MEERGNRHTNTHTPRINGLGGGSGCLEGWRVVVVVVGREERERAVGWRIIIRL